MMGNGPALDGARQSGDIKFMSDVSGRRPGPGNPNWRPGVSGNPAGRPRRGFAFTEMVREVSGQPGVMRALALRVLDVAMGRSVCIDPEWQRACQLARAEGREPPPEPQGGERMQPTMAEQQRAQEFLFKYGGLATTHQTVELEGVQTPIDFGRLSPAELDAMERTLAKAAGYEDQPSRVIDVSPPAELPPPGDGTAPKR